MSSWPISKPTQFAGLRTSFQPEFCRTGLFPRGSQVEGWGCYRHTYQARSTPVEAERGVTFSFARALHDRLLIKIWACAARCTLLGRCDADLVLTTCPWSMGWLPLVPK